MGRVLITNAAAVSMMVLTHSTSAALHTIDPWYATLINMPVGAQVFALLLFGYWVLPGLLLGSILSYIIFPILSYNNGFSYDAGAILVDCLAPAVALYSMHFFRLASFFTGIFGSPITKKQHLQALKEEQKLIGPGIYFGDAKSDEDAAAAFGLDFVFISGVSDWVEGDSYCTENNIMQFTNFHDLNESILGG